MRALLVVVLGAFLLGIAWLTWGAGTNAETAVAPVETPPTQGPEESPAGLAQAVARPSERRARESLGQAGPDVAAAGAGGELQGSETGGLLVRVIDAGGMPAGGIDLELMLSIPGGQSDDIEKTVTDAVSGQGRFPLEQLAGQEEAMRRAGYAGRFSVRANLASADPIEVSLEGWPADGDEVDLVLPPLGNVLVSVVGPQGEALEGDANLYWAWLPAEVAAADPDERYEYTRNRSVSGGADKPLRIERVGLGVCLEINASVAGRAGNRTRGIAGPIAGNESVEVAVRVGEPLAELVFRCRDGQGNAIADEKVRVHVVERTAYSAGPLGKPRRGSTSLRTSNEGVARLSQQAGEFVAERWLEVAAGAAEPRSEDELGLCGGWVALPARLAAGAVIELPPVTLTPAGAVLEGIVTNPDGAPIEDAIIYVNQVLHPGARVAWNSWDWSTRTGEDGRFRILDVAQPKSLAMRVSAKGHNDDYEDGLVSGGEGLAIVLEPAEPQPQGTLHLQVEMPPDVSYSRCLLRLRHEGGRTHTPDWFAGYRLNFDYLMPGRWDVWVETRDGDFELGRVDGIVVREGEVTEDSRLLPLDLSDSARSLTFIFQHADGTPRRRESIAIGFVETGQGLNARTDDKGEATILIPTSFQAGRVQVEAGTIADFTVPPEGEPLRITL